MASVKPLGLYLGEVEGFATGDYIPITSGGTGAITKTAAFNNLSPLTTAGDLLAFDGTNNVRFATGGTVGYVLSIANYLTPTKLAWIPVEVTAAILQTNVDTLNGSIAAAAARVRAELAIKVPVSGGTTGQVLAKNSNDDYDTVWISPVAGTSVTGMLKGDGTNILLATPDVDYITLNTFSDLDSYVRLSVSKLKKTLDVTNFKAFPAVGNTIKNTIFVDNTNGGLPYWGTAPLADVNYVTPSTLVSSLQDMENAYRLADRKVSDKVDNVDVKGFIGFPGAGDTAKRFLTIDNTYPQRPYWSAQPLVSSIDINSGVFYSNTNTDSAGNVSIGFRSNSTGMIRSFDYGDGHGVLSIAVPGTDYATPAQAVPTGGTTGQVLAKNSNSNNDVVWVNSGGGASIVAMDVVLGYDSVNTRWKNTDTDTITVTVTGATVGQKVIVAPNGIPAAAGLDQAPYSTMELDMFTCVAYVSATNTIRITAMSIKGILKGNYSIIILFG